MRRLEEIGKKFKRTGYFNRTAMWKWRNVIGGTIIGFALTVDITWYLYCKKHYSGEKIDRRTPQEKDDSERMEARRQDLLNRRAQLLGDTPAVEVQDIFKKFFSK